jgi:hypothetical protein
LLCARGFLLLLALLVLVSDQVLGQEGLPSVLCCMDFVAVDHRIDLASLFQGLAICACETPTASEA